MNKKLTAGLAAFFLVAAVNVAARAQDAAPGWQGAKTIGDGFGVQIKEWRVNPATLDDIKASGFSYLRYGIGWSTVEQNPGTYDWTKPDAIINAALERNLSSVIILTFGHPKYTGIADAKPDNPDHLQQILLPPTTPEAVAAYARFAAAAAQRYKDKRITFELGNEPDLDRFWHPRADAKAYAVMASAACEAMHQAVPGVKVIGPGAAGMPGWHDRARVGFIETVLKSPAGKCLDALSVHDYRIVKGQPDANPESVIDDNAKAISFIADHTPSGQKLLPLLCSEWGYTTTKVTPEQQAGYVLRMNLSNLLSGIPLTINYEWQDSHKGDRDDEAHFGLLDYSGAPKPAMTAVKALLPKIRDDIIEKRLDAGDQQNFVLQLRQPDGNRALLYWTAAEPAAKGAVIQVSGNNSYPLTGMPQLLPVGPTAPSIKVMMQPK